MHPEAAEKSVGDYFHPVDIYFSKRLLKEPDVSASLFLAYLLKTAREGHLCVEAENGSLFPSLHPELDFHIAKGAERLPSYLFEKALVREKKRIYLRRNWECEEALIKHWKRLRDQKPSDPICLDWLREKLANEALLPEQKQAVLEISGRCLSFLLGGPGTGKTYTAKILIKLFLEKLPGRFAIAAPTGKATGNLRSALKNLPERCTICTLQSLLKERYLSESFILIDEASMIDAELMRRLFESVKNGARLLFLGDPDQLPPVESGNLFADLAKKTQTSHLKTCLRAEIAEISNLANKVKEGSMIPHLPLPNLPELLNTISERENENFRVLTPLRKGPLGSENLNALLYGLSLKKGKQIIPIMIKANDPFQELYNGDVGYLDLGNRQATFGERIYPQYLLPHYEYAFAHSIHKSQGSEYDHVLILIPKGAEVFGRELIYTALTRAKKKVEILADTNVLEKMLSQNTKRLSGIRDQQ